MSTAQELVDQGVAKGIEQGARNVLVRLLRARFGRVSKDVTKRLESASAEDLATWSERVLDASSIDEVFTPPKKKTPSGRGRRGKG